MTPTTALFALFGAGAGTGVWLTWRGWSTRPRRPRSRRQRRGPQERTPLRVATAAGVGAIGGVVTGWVVGALLVTLAVWALPSLLAHDRNRARRLARIEAVATWAEMMRDTLAAAAGLEQAILASAAVTPDAIHTEITTLATRLEAGHPLAPSLRHLADDLADPTADLVISALVLASTQQARNLSELLGSLAATAREQVAMRLRVEAARARTRTSARIIAGTTMTFAALLVLLNREFLTAYDTTTGQLALAGIGGLFAVGFAGLAKIAVVAEPTRLLALPEPGQRSATP